ncbi:MAG: class I SAM-dependent methyltransferase [Acidobacteriota bacterium]|nr:class I SAM-dependent methyltransferase [Acidobacteriota bacterium]
MRSAGLSTEQTDETGSRESPYDTLAHNYRAYSETRGDYLRAVDEVIKSRIKGRANSLLDVGAGDGVRAASLARDRGIRRLVLAEPSPVMADYCRSIPDAEVWQTAAEELPAYGQKFDIITCLWNVLGHVDTEAKRLAALSRMRSLLEDGGLIFLDVNNRYNARAYGMVKTAARALFDLVRPSETNGDVSFDWNIEGRCVRARGHVFTPKEMASLVSRAGLHTRERLVIDYRSGALRRFVFQGQLLYVLEDG